MRRLLQIFACSVALTALGLPLAATALASGTGTSAGDQQYVDPLTTSTAKQPSSTSSSPPTQSASASPSSASATASSSSAGATTSTASSSGSAQGTGAAHAAGATLPYTGFNVGVCLAVGVAMLGGGLLLRRIVRRA